MNCCSIRNRFFIPIFLLLSFAAGLKSLAQLSGNNLMEYQLGNIPDVDPADLSTLYDQLNLQYRHKELKTSLRIEQFYTNDSLNRNYTKVTQWHVQYRHKKIELNAGNFFETLGRGLLFRPYEIPSSIKEERTFRVRQGFYRDLLGASFKYRGDVFSLKAIYGQPLQNSFPPGNEYQRVETIEAVQPEIRLWKQNLGLIAMRHSLEGTNTLYSSLFLKGSLPLNLSYYGEYARNMTQNANPLQFSVDEGYGIYFSLGHSYGNYGSSIELKQYRNFTIGTGIADPPTLVKEHSYRLLNRSTHIPELSSEQGYQVDLFYTLEDGKMISFNHSRAQNIVIDTFIFAEVFLEYYWPFESGSYLKSYLDFSKDEVLKENERYALGLYYTHMITPNWSVGIETELQRILKFLSDTKNITNVYLGLVLNQSTKFSFSLYYEYTDDPVIADRPDTPETESSRHFYGFGISYRPNSQHTLNAFLGERRGGPACISGICYEVLDFRGLELRWTTKF